ncbi:hypothetical protein [Tenacibaculum sp.]
MVCGTSSKSYSNCLFCAFTVSKQHLSIIIAIKKLRIYILYFKSKSTC